MDDAIKHVAKAIGHTVVILKNLDRVNGIKEPSGWHSKRSGERDMHIPLKQLHEKSCVLATIFGCEHRCFPKFEYIVQSMSVTSLTEWMQEQLKFMSNNVPLLNPVTTLQCLYI